MLKKQVFEIDEQNFIKEIYVADIDDYGNILDIDKQGFITVDIPSGLFKPRWTGIRWLEGETAEERAERDAQQLLESLKPSLDEIANAELEIKMLTMLTELGVIQ